LNRVSIFGIFFEFLLAGIEFCIVSVLCQQRVVGADLHDFSIFKNNYLIESEKRKNTMGDDQGGPISQVEIGPP
jgi:hypothetical protein